jgi:hypothetical protein
MISDAYLMVEIKCYLSNKHVGLLKKAQATVINQNSTTFIVIMLHTLCFTWNTSFQIMHNSKSTTDSSSFTPEWALFLHTKIRPQNTSLRHIQTNDIWNYPHSHGQFDVLNLNTHLEIHHSQKLDQLPLYAFNVVERYDVWSFLHPRSITLTLFNC